MLRWISATVRRARSNSTLKSRCRPTNRAGSWITNAEPKYTLHSTGLSCTVSALTNRSETPRPQVNVLPKFTDYRNFQIRQKCILPDRPPAQKPHVDHPNPARNPSRRNGRSDPRHPSRHIRILRRFARQAVEVAEIAVPFYEARKPFYQRHARRIIQLGLGACQVGEGAFNIA